MVRLNSLMEGIWVQVRPIFKICLATYQLCGPGQVIQASPGLNSLACTTGERATSQDSPED